MTELSAIHPYYFPELFQSIWLGTMQSPGVVTLSGHDRNKAWDNQAAKGSEGASSKLNGDPIGGFQASFYLAGDEDDEGGAVGSNDFDRWDLFQLVIESTFKGPEPKALPIFHPDLARNGFTEVVAASVGGLVRDSRGGATVLVKFQEYKPPKPKPVVKPKSKGTGASPGAANAAKVEKPDPNAAAKRELAGLVEEARQP